MVDLYSVVLTYSLPYFFMSTHHAREGWPSHTMVTLDPNDRESFLDLASETLEKYKRENPKVLDKDIARHFSVDPTLISAIRYKSETSYNLPTVAADSWTIKKVTEITEGLLRGCIIRGTKTGKYSISENRRVPHTIRKKRKLARKNKDRPEEHQKRAHKEATTEAPATKQSSQQENIKAFIAIIEQLKLLPIAKEKKVAMTIQLLEELF